MRTHFDNLLKIEPKMKGQDIEEFLYMSYWYGGLYVVIEGWQSLGLSDPKIDKLLSSENVPLLKRYRNATFHYQKKYYDDRFVDFMSKGKDVVFWVRELNRQFGRYFLIPRLVKSKA
jgi:hypothetical protein